LAKFLIVEARFYEHLNDQLIAGARAALKAAGHKADVVTVPGALEIPAAIALAEGAAAMTAMSPSAW
jgi:6,7-dimethyl-8-ribityllumazine synthase